MKKPALRRPSAHTGPMRPFPVPPSYTGKYLYFGTWGTVVC